MLSLLTGKALEWATTVWDKDEQIHKSFTYFSQQIKEIFNTLNVEETFLCSYYIYGKGNYVQLIMQYNFLC